MKVSKEDREKLKPILLNTCADYEPWAEMMNLGGAGDGGVDHFPLDLFSGEIEIIDITFLVASAVNAVESRRKSNPIHRISHFLIYLTSDSLNYYALDQKERAGWLALLLCTIDRNPGFRRYCL